MGKPKIKASLSGIISLLILYFLNGHEYFIFMLICALAHEAGHFIAMFITGCPPTELTVGFFNLNIKYNKATTSYKKDIIISLSGSAVSLLLSVLGICTNDFQLFYVNLVLGAVNLLPIKGLDGGNALYAIICMMKKEKYSLEKNEYMDLSSLERKMGMCSNVIAFSFVILLSFISEFNLSVVFTGVSALICPRVNGNFL